MLAFQRNFHGLFQIATRVLFFNILLLFVFGMVLGGSPGKVENGQYYLVDHGTETKVSYAVYLFVEVHTASVLTCGAIYILAAFMGILTGSFHHKPKSFNFVSNSQNIFIRNILVIIEFFVEALILVLDVWRKPCSEFFIRQNYQDAMAKLAGTSDKDQSEYLGFFINKSFLIMKWTEFSSKEIKSVLTGRLIQTAKGTYVKIWFRMEALAILFFSLFLSVFAVAAFFLFIHGVVSEEVGDNLYRFAFFVFYMLFVALLSKISSSWNIEKRTEMISFVKCSLSDSANNFVDVKRDD
jgi:hypothetical protein